MESSRVVVVGAGVAGMSTARSLAAAGARVTLIEKGERLGGMAADYACKGTDRCNKCNVCLVHELVRDVKSRPDIHVMTGCTVDGAEALSSGGYRLKVGGREVECSAVVLATGFEPFDASMRPELGYGALPAVVSALDLEKALRDGGGIGEKFRRPIGKVAFVQCVGSRDLQRGRGYCSRVCCMYSLRMARAVRHRNPSIETTVFYMDFQGAGKDPGDLRRRAEAEDGVRFVRARPSEVAPAPDGRAVVWFEDLDGGICRPGEFDLVVLAVGTGPGRDTRTLADMFGLGLDEFGFFAPADPGDEAATGVPGVFVAGTCRGPRDIAESVADGERAALAVLHEQAARRARQKIALSLSAGTWPGRRVLRGQPETVEVSSTVLVLGGTAEGMEAARTLSDLGCRTVIVGEETGSDGDSGAAYSLLARVDEDSSIDVLAGGRLVRLDGQAGGFRATIEGPGGLVSEIGAGALIVATGYRREFPEAARGLAGRACVVGLSELSRGAEMLPTLGGVAGDCTRGVKIRLPGSMGRILAKRAPLGAPSPHLEESGVPWAVSEEHGKGRGGRRAVIWVGVRPDTARAVFREAISAALSALAAGWEVYVLCPEVAVAGPGDEELYLEARRQGAVFVKYDEEPEVQAGSALRVLVRDPCLGAGGAAASAADDVPGLLAVDADVLVVAEEAYPPPDSPELARVLQVNTGPLGFFQDDNVNFLPVLTNRRGIFAIGGCRGATAVADAMVDAHVAAYLAARLVGTGSLHVDWATARVDPDKCALCLTCVRTCPHRAVDVDDEMRAARISRAACWGCGVCASECPGKAISLESCSDDEILASVAPGVTAFCCDHSALIAAEATMAALPTDEAAGLNIVAVPCTGKVDIIHLLKAFERGAEAVMVAGCFDEGCHFLSGNRRARLRVGQAASLLKAVGIEPERVRFYHIGPDMSAAFLEAVQETMQVARELGPVVRRRAG
ncbi:MAG: FAD-dependent oxidoreductase [Firmicutes bacterium]|nr:FAD-dependent oxidoreductase [Bacillota bacterium]